MLAGAPVTTTTAAVVSQSPQLYNQQTNSPDSPVIVALLAFGARASLGGISGLTVASAHSFKVSVVQQSCEMSQVKLGAALVFIEESPSISFL